LNYKNSPIYLKKYSLCAMQFLVAGYAVGRDEGELLFRCNASDGDYEDGRG